MKVLVTGAAGFIGYHVAERLLARGDEVIGLDNVNDYYDISLKEARLARLTANARFSFARIDLADRDAVAAIFAKGKFAAVVHLAAQAGVRYSLKDPFAYVDSNLSGFVTILEGCRHAKVGHLVYASSSSVYGANTVTPFSVHQNVDHPLSLYAATKKANELLAHSYAHLYGIPVTGLRFFTVYGPWGRPDMAYFLFTRAIFRGEPIDVFNNGDMQRDFTYVDDVVEGVVRVLDRPPAPDPGWRSRDADAATSSAPYRLYNIGNNRPISLGAFIETLESCIGSSVKKNYLPMQPGDLPSTVADIDDLVRDVGFAPSTPIEIGLQRFVSWYREYYGISTAASS
jgi:UDP-glucuronate 4-epimerase